MKIFVLNLILGFVAFSQFYCDPDSIVCNGSFEQHINEPNEVINIASPTKKWDMIMYCLNDLSALPYPGVKPPYKYFNRSSLYWSTLNEGSPDFFSFNYYFDNPLPAPHEDENYRLNIPENMFGMQYPADLPRSDQNHYVGIYTYINSNLTTKVNPQGDESFVTWHEYLAIPLNKPLEEGYNYVVTFKVSCGNFRGSTTNYTRTGWQLIGSGVDTIAKSDPDFKYIYPKAGLRKFGAYFSKDSLELETYFRYKTGLMENVYADPKKMEHLVDNFVSTGFKANSYLFQTSLGGEYSDLNEEVTNLNHERDTWTTFYKTITPNEDLNYMAIGIWGEIEPEDIWLRDSNRTFDPTIDFDFEAEFYFYIDSVTVTKVESWDCCSGETINYWIDGKTYGENDSINYDPDKCCYTIEFKPESYCGLDHFEVKDFFGNTLYEKSEIVLNRDYDFCIDNTGWDEKIPIRVLTYNNDGQNSVCSKITNVPNCIDRGYKCERIKKLDTSNPNSISSTDQTVKFYKVDNGTSECCWDVHVSAKYHDKLFNSFKLILDNPDAEFTPDNNFFVTENNDEFNFTDLEGIGKGQEVKIGVICLDPADEVNVGIDYELILSELITHPDPQNICAISRSETLVCSIEEFEEDCCDDIIISYGSYLFGPGSGGVKAKQVNLSFADSSICISDTLRMLQIRTNGATGSDTVFNFNGEAWQDRTRNSWANDYFEIHFSMYNADTDTLFNYDFYFVLPNGDTCKKEVVVDYTSQSIEKSSIKDNNKELNQKLNIEFNKDKFIFEDKLDANLYNINKISEITIYNSYGSTVKSINYDGNLVDITNLSNGVYSIKFINEERKEYYSIFYKR